MMAKPEVSIKGMKNADPHGARPNRTQCSCNKLSYAANRNIVKKEGGLLPAHIIFLFLKMRL